MAYRMESRGSCSSGSTGSNGDELIYGLCKLLLSAFQSSIHSGSLGFGSWVSVPRFQISPPTPAKKILVKRIYLHYYALYGGCSKWPLFFPLVLLLRTSLFCLFAPALIEALLADSHQKRHLQFN